MARKRNGKQPAAEPIQRNPTEDEIRLRAYEIYLARNGGPGSELDDWLKAAQELLLAANLPPGD